MTLWTWLGKIPRPLRLILASLVRLYGVALESLAARAVRRATDAPIAYGVKLVVPAGENQALYTERLHGALDLLAHRAPRALQQVRKEITAVVVLPRRIRKGGSYSHRARIVMLDQRVVWRWSTEALATELVGWAVDARLRGAGFSADRFRERRDHRVLLEKITLGGRLLGMEDAAAEVRAQAIREQAGEDSSPAAT